MSISQYTSPRRIQGRADLARGVNTRLDRLYRIVCEEVVGQQTLKDVPLDDSRRVIVEHIYARLVEEYAHMFAVQVQKCHAEYYHRAVKHRIEYSELRRKAKEKKHED